MSSRKMKIKKRLVEALGGVWDPEMTDKNRLRNRRRRGIIDLVSGKVIRTKVKK